MMGLVWLALFGCVARPPGVREAEAHPVRSFTRLERRVTDIVEDCLRVVGNSRAARDIAVVEVSALPGVDIAKVVDDGVNIHVTYDDGSFTLLLLDSP